MQREKQFTRKNILRNYFLRKNNFRKLRRKKDKKKKMATLLKESKTGKRKFINDEEIKDGENLPTLGERKTKITRPGQPSSLWTCQSKIFGGCQETKHADAELLAALNEKNIPYYFEKETCDSKCGIPSELVNEIAASFSGGKSASSLRQTASLLKDLQKGQEEKNEQQLLQLLDQYLSAQELYEEKKINYRESTEMKRDNLDSMIEMFKLGQGKDFYNFVLKKVLTAGDVFSLVNVIPFGRLMRQLPKSFLSKNVDWSNLMKAAIDLSYKAKPSKDEVTSLVLLFGWANVASPLSIDSFFRKNTDYLRKLTIILDNYLEDNYNSIIDMLEIEDPVELILPLYSTTFLRYYLEQSKFKDIVKVGEFLRRKNKEILTIYESKPTSEKTESVLENIEKYKTNQTILDELFLDEDQEDYEGDHGEGDEEE